ATVGVIMMPLVVSAPGLVTVMAPAVRKLIVLGLPCDPSMTAFWLTVTLVFAPLDQSSLAKVLSALMTPLVTCAQLSPLAVANPSTPLTGAAPLMLLNLTPAPPAMSKLTAVP